MAASSSSTFAAASITRKRGDPANCYRKWQREIKQGLLLVEFSVRADWLEHAPLCQLTAVFCQSEKALSMTVTDQVLCEDNVPFYDQYAIWIERHELLDYQRGRVLALKPSLVPKPWGQEVWFSGVERRGVCEVGSEDRRIPLPWLQAAWPESLSGIPSDPLLLVKELLPSAKPVVGDLYFELHETKYESYVVTAIDPRAWPNGVGYLRLGFCHEQRAVYASDAAFRSAYLKAVLAYQEQRNKIDDALTVGQATTPEDIARECLLRAEMDQFTHLRPVRVGDTVLVPPYFPHALQHGVHVLEVQTPTYERKILSFAQKVRTQSHWDTSEAVATMRLDPPPDQCPMDITGSRNSRTTRIVNCTAFELLRVVLDSGCEDELATENRYNILFVITGQLLLDGAVFGPHEALLLPAQWRGKVTASGRLSPLSFILARPAA